MIMNNFSLADNRDHNKNLKKWFREHPQFAETKSPLKDSSWSCRDCCMVFTSQDQAEQHFVGRKHLNMIKNKSVYQYYDNKMSFMQTDVKNKRIFNNFQNVYSSGNPYLSSFFKSNTKFKKTTDNLISDSDNKNKMTNKSEKNDLSIFRTPTGKYYCQTCNITITSHVQFWQHMQSRKHRYKNVNNNFKSEIMSRKTPKDEIFFKEKFLTLEELFK